MTDFIKQLNKDIDTYKKIKEDSNKFIKHHNLKAYKFLKNIKSISDADLPICASLGSVYLIKNNNIIHFYSYCDNAYSLYSQVNMKKPMWICKPHIINIEKDDPEHIQFLLDGTKIIYAPSNLSYLILDFIHAGFNLYVLK